MILRCRIFSKVLLFIFASFLILARADAEPTLKVMDGRVKEVSVEKHEFVLSYRHPVSGQMEEQVFRVDAGTGFPEGVHFEDLRPNQPVSVDYQEDGEGHARVVRVRRVPLRGVPIDQKLVF